MYSGIFSFKKNNCFISKIGYIYIIINPRGCIYIGQTVDLLDRINHYKCGNCKKQTKLYNSLIKYGWENHSFRVIEACSEQIIDDREIYYIEIYKSNYTKYRDGNGLNLKSGGKGKSRRGSTVSDLQKQKIKSKLVGVKRPLEVVEKVKEGNKKYWDSDRSKQARQDLSNRMRLANAIPIIQYTLDGEYIREWKCAAEAGDTLGLDKMSINGCCNKRYKQAARFIWRFATDTSPIEKVVYGAIKKILQFDKDGNLVKEWGCIKDAAKLYNVSDGAINYYLNRPEKLGFGFYWKYAPKATT